MKHRIPILLTSSAIAYDAGVTLKDTKERTRLTLESVREWLQMDPRPTIVLCDGSNFDFTALVAQNFPDATVECLHFENDQEQVRRNGRGYGEGEIVRYALNHSRLIAEAGCFAKCTAKLWVSNFQQCARQWNGRFLCKGVFLDAFSPFKKTRLAYIDTRFYMTSVDFYRDYFVDAHLRVSKQSQHGLEECFLETLLEKNIKKSLFTVMPVIAGVGGGTGTYYRNPFKRRIKEDLRLWLVRQQDAYQDLFVD